MHNLMLNYKCCLQLIRTSVPFRNSSTILSLMVLEDYRGEPSMFHMYWLLLCPWAVSHSWLGSSILVSHVHVSRVLSPSAFSFSIAILFKELMVEETLLRELGTLSSGTSNTSILASFIPYAPSPQRSSPSPGTPAAPSSNVPSRYKKDKRQIQWRYCHLRGHIIAKCREEQCVDAFLRSQQHTPTAALTYDLVPIASSDETMPA